MSSPPSTPYVDTSALAKWYLNEPLSETVEAYLRSLPSAAISSLTAVEMRCLLARRRRATEITAEQEMRCQAVFEDDVGEGYLQLLPLEDSHAQVAIRLIETLPGHPLRTLDALHLAIARAAGLEVVATADRVMADAAEAIGFTVKTFLE
jgi:predicted nucleic acid-binding protein